MQRREQQGQQLDGVLKTNPSHTHFSDAEGLVYYSFQSHFKEGHFSHCKQKLFSTCLKKRTVKNEMQLARNISTY